VNLIRFFSNPRVAVATVFLAIAFASIVAGGYALALFLAVLIFLGTQELAVMARKKGMSPNIPLVVIVDAILLIIALTGYYIYFPLAITLGVIATFAAMLYRGHSATIKDTAVTLLGFLYGGWLPMHILLLRGLEKNRLHLSGFSCREGLGFIVIMFFVITFSDIFAYYIGKNFGKTPLCPEISPKKTVEGALAGTFGGIFASIIIGNLIHLPIYHSIIAGTLMVLAAQFGDLCESMLKRDAGMKDSGNLLPGHGGFLDRADSYIFTGAVAYYYFSIFVIGN